MNKEPRCASTISAGDDFGDNSCTFHCQLTSGHEGRCQEVGKLDGIPYTLTWDCLAEALYFTKGVSYTRKEIEDTAAKHNYTVRPEAGGTCLIVEASPGRQVWAFYKDEDSNVFDVFFTNFENLLPNDN